MTEDSLLQYMSLSSIFSYLTIVLKSDIFEQYFQQQLLCALIATNIFVLFVRY